MINQNGNGFAELAINSPNYIPKSRSLSWLREYVEDFNPHTFVFPIERILRDSLYYPACFLDMRPINALEKSINSFVYADVCLPKEKIYQHFLTMRYQKDELVEELDFNDYFYNNIKDYVPFFVKEFRIEDFGFDRHSPIILPSDIYDNDHKDGHVKHIHDPYVIWILLEKRRPYYGRRKVISLLFFGGEMSTIYQSLYNRNNIAPKAVMFYGPGMGFWDCREIAPERYQAGHFFEHVMRNNEAGMPTFYISKEWNNYGDRNKTLSGYEDLEDCQLLKKKPILLLTSLDDFNENT